MKGDQGQAAPNVPLRIPQGATGNLKSYTPVQLHFLMRLSHLQKQRRESSATLEATDWRMRLMNKSLYSTFRDCEEQGVGDEARLLMAQQTSDLS